jgi:ribosome-interacting GTPase 1
MPTNLPPEALDKWEKVQAAHTPKEKMDAMIEFLKYVPHHKGTMKLRGEMNRKIALIQDDLEKKKRMGTGKSSGGPKLFIEKGAQAQVVLVGKTNVGKSSLMNATTNSKVVVTPTPFSTHTPMPGIMNYQDVQYQIVEAPAVMEGAAEGKANGNVTLGLARNADGVVIMLDMSEDPIEQLDLILAELEKTRVLVTQFSGGRVDIERRPAGSRLRIINIGRLKDCSFKEVEELLRDYRITDAIVRISGDVSLEDVENAIYENTIYKPAVIVANKLDIKGTAANLKKLQAYVGNKLPIVPMSCERKLGVPELGKAIFDSLGMIRIYTKEPGQKTHSDHPFALRKGATVQELTKNIHKELLSNFLFAMVWAKRLPFSPKKVGLNFVLDDGDIIEIHAKT